MPHDLRFPARARGFFESIVYLDIAKGDGGSRFEKNLSSSRPWRRGGSKPIIANNDKNKYNVWETVKVKLIRDRGDERWKKG